MTSNINQTANSSGLARKNPVNHIGLDSGAAGTGQISWAPFIILGFILAGAAAYAINNVTTSPELFVIGGIIGLILAITIIQKPELGVYLIIFAVFTNLSDLFTEKKLPSINKPLVAIIVLGIFINYILKTGRLDPRPKFTRIDLTILLYVFVVFASTYVAINPDNSNIYLLDLIKDVAIGLCIYLTLNSRERWETGIKVLILALTFVSFLGVLHTLGNSDQTFWGFAQDSAFGQTTDSGQLRFGGPIAEANIWGQVLVSALPFIFYRMLQSPTLVGKSVYSLSGAIIFMAMLFTQSRGAFLALVVVLVLIAIERRIKGPTLLALFGLGMLALFILPDQYTERIRNFGIVFQSNQNNGTAQDESVQGRREKMITGLAMFKANPFLGVGFANYTDNYWTYAGNLGLEASTINSSSTDSQRQPHSLYIEIMAETGIFGIITFLGFLGMIFVELYKLRNKYKTRDNIYDKNWTTWLTSTIMSLLTFLVAGFFLHGIGFRYIWVLTGMCVALIHISKNDLSTKSIKQAS